MQDRLRLLVQKPNEDAPISEVEAAPRAASIETRFEGISASCALVDALPPMHVAR
jgi:hypothetical protein